MNKPDTIITFFILVLAIMLASPVTLPAQDNEQYFTANRLLQQREYEQAYELFSGLHRKNPRVYLYFDKMTECLINLKAYEEAIEKSRAAASRSHYPAEAKIRLGEIFYIQRDSARASSVWNEVIRENSENLQVHLSLARAMSDRRAYEQAVGVYRKAADMFPDQRMFTNEIAHTYLLAGRYEESIQQYLKLIKENPERSGFVQSMLLRFDDEDLYDVAILELDDFLEELSYSHSSYRSMQQLYLWLLMERELFERALAEAKRYEDSQSRVTYSLFSLGAQLASDRKFQLAEEAFLYYIDRNIRTAKYQSLQELGNIYIEWADYLSDYNLSTHQRRKDLYQRAYSVLERIITEEPNYRGINEVHFRLSELGIDYLHNPGIAEKYLEKVQVAGDSSYLARQKYMEGRIELYKGNYARARIALSGSNRQERIGSLADKARYYLALADFFAGDYEYAKIQLNALERQTTSYFANDAVQLRSWIQEGLQADSTGQILNPFSAAVEWLSRGETDSAMNRLGDVLDFKTYHPLADDALVEMSSHATPSLALELFDLIDRYLSDAGRYSPLRERLMWEQARLADEGSGAKEGYPSSATPISLTRKELTALYEEIILEYPDGFYASYARQRIEEIENIQT